MACTCIDKINDKLRARNTRMALTIVFSSPMGAFPTISTEQIEKGRGKPKATALIPSFCPFCGTGYEARQVADPASAA